MTEEQRAARVAAAGYNLLNLSLDDIELDLLTDVPKRPFVPEVVAAGVEAMRHGTHFPSPATLAAELFGPYQFVFANKGRAAERALVAGLGLESAVAITHPLFRTTHGALRAAGTTIELAPLQGSANHGRADIDTHWLSRRIAAGGVDLVFLEVGTNGLAGWPLTLDHVEEVARICRQNGVLFLLDATRIMANSYRLGGQPLELARRFVALADAFTVSFAKEFLVPNGGMLAVRSRELQQRCFGYAFEQGTLPDPHSTSACLAAGMQYIMEHPEILLERAGQLQLMAESLKSAGVPVIEPLGGHAVYVPMPERWTRDTAACRATESQLYRVTGIRARINHYEVLGMHLLRLCLPIRRYGDAALQTLGDKLRTFWESADRAPVLTPLPDSIHGLFERYRSVASEM